MVICLVAKLMVEGSNPVGIKIFKGNFVHPPFTLKKGESCNKILAQVILPVIRVDAKPMVEGSNPDDNKIFKGNFVHPPNTPKKA